MYYSNHESHRGKMSIIWIPGPFNRPLSRLSVLLFPLRPKCGHTPRSDGRNDETTRRRGRDNCTFLRIPHGDSCKFLFGVFGAHYCIM